MVSKLCLPISSALMLSGAGGMVSLTEAAAVSGSFLKVAPIDRCEALTSEASAALDRAVAQFSRPKAAGPCDLPFSRHTSLFPPGIHPNLSSPWNTSAALLRRSLSPFVAPSLCAK